MSTIYRNLFADVYVRINGTFYVLHLEPNHDRGGYDVTLPQWSSSGFHAANFDAAVIAGAEVVMANVENCVPCRGSLECMVKQGRQG